MTCYEDCCKINIIAHVLKRYPVFDTVGVRVGLGWGGGEVLGCREFF